MPKILLVDDDENILGLISTLLEIEGHQPVKLSRGNQINDVIQQISREMPELILLDVHLQNMDGIELLRKIKESKKISKIPILMSSGMALDEECRKSGADGFIIKPYMPEELIQKINQMIGGSL